MKASWLIVVWVAVGGSCLVARGQTVQDFARFAEESEAVISGIGLVMGLPGTGDDGEYVAMAAPLLALHRNLLNDLPSIEDLEDTNSVALVMVQCRLPPSGARYGDELDADVSVIGNASSLVGGRLYLTALRGPFPGDPVYAMASGKLVIGPDVETSATIRRGVTMIEDVQTMTPRSTMDLRIMPEFASFGVATEMATRINQEWFGTTQTFGPAVATAVDDRTVRLTVPEAQRSDIAAFLADVLATPLSEESLKLPAVVRVNRDTGAIIASADVTIGAVAITHKDLVITTTVPEPVATPEAPLIERSRWAGIGTDLNERATAKLADLQAAFERLDVPAQERVEVLQMLHRSGRLHARLVIEGSDG